MNKLKSLIFVAGVMLFILAAVASYFSIEGIFTITPAEEYEDQGVHVFLPYQVLPVQVENTGATGRSRRMNPTRTVYMVYYRDMDAGGYRWEEQALTREIGQEIVEAKRTVRRRVLCIPDKGTYITIEPEQDAKSYTAGLQQKYVGILSASAAYLLLYLAAWGVIRNRRSR